MIKKVYGLNIAVADLGAATETFARVLGVQGEPIDAEGFAFPGLVGTSFDVNGFHLNLIASTQPGTSVAKFVESKGEGVFLLSLQVDDLGQTLDEMRTQGLSPLLSESAQGPFGKVNFVHPKLMHGVQLEIYEPAE